jgi:hypothetical protein
VGNLFHFTLFSLLAILERFSKESQQQFPNIVADENSANVFFLSRCLNLPSIIARKNVVFLCASLLLAPRNSSPKKMCVIETLCEILPKVHRPIEAHQHDINNENFLYFHIPVGSRRVCDVFDRIKINRRRFTCMNHDEAASQIS